MKDIVEGIHENITKLLMHQYCVDELEGIYINNISNLDYLRSIREKIPRMASEEIFDLISDVVGEEHLESALEKEKGVILLSMHTIFNEIGFIWLAIKGYQAYHVIEYVDQARKEIQYIERIYSEKGAKFIRYEVPFKVKIGTKEFLFKSNTIKEVFSQLQKNRIVSMLPDLNSQHNTKGVYVQMFGKPTYVNYAPMLIARKTRAALIPAVTIKTNDNNFKVVIHPEIEIQKEQNKKDEYRNNMQRYMDFVESFVLQYPDQYTWHFSDG